MTGKKKFKFDFTGKLHKITEERKSKSRESLKDAIDGDAKSRMRKAPSLKTTWTFRRQRIVSSGSSLFSRFY
jgi:hypothetical protein